jgi:hypothetical protein
MLFLGRVWQIKLTSGRRRKTLFPMSADGQVKRMGRRFWSRRHIDQTRPRHLCFHTNNHFILGVALDCSFKREMKGQGNKDGGF